MTTNLITPEQFETARVAFSNAWLECDEKQKQGHIIGPRTSCGLSAALETLGIRVLDDGR